MACIVCLRMNSLVKYPEFLSQLHYFLADWLYKTVYIKAGIINYHYHSYSFSLDTYTSERKEDGCVFIIY